MPVAPVSFAFRPREAPRFSKAFVATLSRKKRLLLLLSDLGHFDFELNTHEHEVRLLGIRFMPLWSLTSNTDKNGPFFCTQAVSCAAYHIEFDWKYAH